MNAASTAIAVKPKVKVPILSRVSLPSCSAAGRSSDTLINRKEPEVIEIIIACAKSKLAPLKLALMPHPMPMPMGVIRAQNASAPHVCRGGILERYTGTPNAIP